MSHDTSNPKEQWRDIPGYEGYYQVSDHGRVRSLDRMILGSGLSFQYRPGMMIILQKVQHTDHLKVRLHRNGHKEDHHVHRLVLGTFDRPRRDGEVCRHLDGNAANNHISNLTWGTPSENNYDQVRHGTHPFAFRTHCPRGHELREPNLRPSALKKGGRTCLACDRGMSYARKYGLMDQVQSIADDRYEKIMHPHRVNQNDRAA